MNDLSVNTRISQAGLDSALVYAQLDRIGADPSFAAAPLLNRLLRYLVEHAVTGDVREVKEYALGVELFDRGPSFDPRSDTIVRANVRRLRTRLEEYYTGAGVNDPLVIEIPKGHYLATFRVTAAPGSAAVDEGTRPPQRTWFAVGLTTSLMLAASMVLLRGTDAPAPQAQAARIAVFAFSAPDGDAEAARLAAGIAEQIVTTMSPHGLPVIAPGEFSTLSAAARAVRASKLNAAYAIDGTVSRDVERRLMASVRIEHLESRTTLWSNTYRASDAATLSLQIATQLTDTLRAAYPEPHARGFGGWFEIAPDDVDSLRMLLEACFRIRTGNPADNRDIFRTLVSRYPDSAELHGALGLTLANSLPSVPVEYRVAQLDEADRAARRAVALDPNRGQGYMAMFDVKKAQGATGSELESLLKEALRRVPEHASVNSYYARLLDTTGRSAAAEVYVRRAVAGDPFSPGKRLNLVNVLLALGKTDEAWRTLHDTAARWPLSSVWRKQLQVALITDPRKLDSLISHPSADADAAELACWGGLEAAAYQSDSGDRRTLGSAAIDHCIADGVLLPDAEIDARVAFGDIGGALARARDFVTWNDPGVETLLRTRSAALQRDPRFMPLMQQLGLVDLWRSSDRWPDFCALPTLPYDCRAEATPSH
jgi:TolB-like protein